jgi:N-methylhydantoinase A
MSGKEKSLQHWRIGIDTGGTFTDGILWNETDGQIVTAKILSTPDDPARAVLAMVNRLLAACPAAHADAISYLVHGTTVATNAVLQHQRAPCALVTTSGFRDILEIARQVRDDAYDMFAVKPPPLVPRQRCFEVIERMDASGKVVLPLDIGTIERAARQIAASGVKAVAVCLLHAYRNPSHERKVGESLRAQLPGVAVSLSSDLSSEFREFQRACTTIINASLMPEVSTYLRALDSALADRELTGGRLVMQSNGGVSEFAESADRPVFLIESGPAAGVVAAAHFTAVLGEKNIISFDMGGTTAKVGTLRDGKPARVSEFEIGVSANRWRGWNAGAAGYPILTPAVDMIEVGTGGGSVAWVDDGGKLRVGPKSAGAAPGPVCYGQGGTMPTITDADLVLGRIDPDYFLGGEMRLDVPASHRAMAALAERIGLTPDATAAGIVQIADAAMAQALRVVSVQRGYDPATFKLVPFGGAGPLHALAIAADTGIGTVLVPPRPGVASALGLLVADLKHDNARTIAQPLNHVTEGQLAAVFAELEAKGREPLVREGVPNRAMRFEWSFDLRYVGQSYHLNIALPRGPLDSTVIKEARRRFDVAHDTTYGYAEPDEPCELVNIRVSAVGVITKPKLEDSVSCSRSSQRARTATRSVWFQQTGFTECAIYERLGLPQGEQIDGPAVIEDRDAATLVHPGWRCSLESFGVLAIRRIC